MPPENAPAPVETTTPQPITGNAPEARNPDGSLKDGLSAVPAIPTEPTPKTTDGETSTPKTPEGAKPSLLNQKIESPLATGAPEKYEFKSLPEGMEVTEKALSFFKENAMSQAQADAAVKFYHDLASEAANAPYKQWQEMNDGWVKNIVADPEYKGNIDNVKSVISKFVDSIGDAKLASDLREAMDLTGAGNNPAFVKFMFRLGLANTEGTHVPATTPSRFGQMAPGASERPTVGRALYPNLP